VKKKSKLLDLNSCVYWIIKPFNVVMLVLHALYSPAEVELSSRDPFCLGLDFHLRVAWISAALRQDELSVLANYRRLRNVMQLTSKTWMQSSNNPNDSIRKIYSSC
jgi:hypothetical protein